MYKAYVCYLERERERESYMSHSTSHHKEHNHKLIKFKIVIKFVVIHK